jgi:hypothetical protein
MEDRWVGLIEIAFSFGLVLAFGVWQLLSLRRLRREREAKEAAEDAARNRQGDGAA